jgi:type IV secretion system protein VirB10
MNIFLFGRGRRDKSDAKAENVIEGERDDATVDRGMRAQNKATNLVIIVSVVAVAGLALWRYYAAVYNRHKEAAETQAETPPPVPAILPPLKTPVFSEPRPEMTLPSLSPAAIPAGVPVSAAGPVVTSTGAATGTNPLTPAQQRMKQRLESPLAFKLPDTLPSSGGLANVTSTGAGPLAPVQAAGNVPAGATLQSQTAASRAYMLADPGMTITRGTKIPCHVVEALDTTLPGPVTCIQTEDVRGADGKVVLLERGTKWVGVQANGVAQGQRRVGIVWSRGETPNHVLVDVDSIGADWLGRPGIAGDVDNHFWDRFGAAILLSVISDIGPYLTALHQGGGNNNTTIAFPNITGGAQQVMSDVLKTTLNIPPTLTAPQASQVVIHVARDLDFRDVYALQERTFSER